MILFSTFRLKLAIFFLLTSLVYSQLCGQCKCIASGSWDNPLIWSNCNSSIPTSLDTVEIKNNFRVSIPNSFEARCKELILYPTRNTLDTVLLTLQTDSKLIIEGNLNFNPTQGGTSWIIQDARSVIDIANQWKVNASVNGGNAWLTMKKGTQLTIQKTLDVQQRNKGSFKLKANGEEDSVTISILQGIKINQHKANGIYFNLTNRTKLTSASIEINSDSVLYSTDSLSLSATNHSSINVLHSVLIHSNQNRQPKSTLVLGSTSSLKTDTLKWVDAGSTVLQMTLSDSSRLETNDFNLEQSPTSNQLNLTIQKGSTLSVNGKMKLNPDYALGIFKGNTRG